MWGPSNLGYSVNQGSLRHQLRLTGECVIQTPPDGRFSKRRVLVQKRKGKPVTWGVFGNPLLVGRSMSGCQQVDKQVR